MSHLSSNGRWAVLLPVFAALVLAGFWLAGPSREEGDPKSLVVYCAHDSVYADVILKDFERQTGIRVDVRYDTEATKSLGLVNLIVAERQRPRCDVFWNNELLGTVDLQSQGLLEPHKGTGWERLPEKYRDADGHWVGFAARLRVQIVNTGEVSADDEAIQNLFTFEPASVAVAKPLFGTTLTHYTVLWDEWGPERLKAWHHDLRLRGVREVDGNGAVKDLVAQGVCHAGLTDTDDFFVALDEGKPVEMLPVVLPPSPRRGGLGRGDDGRENVDPVQRAESGPSRTLTGRGDGVVAADGRRTAKAAPLPGPPRRGEGGREGEGTRREGEDKREETPHPNPLPSKARGEGTEPKAEEKDPLTLALSPEDGGEGTEPKPKIEPKAKPKIEPKAKPEPRPERGHGRTICIPNTAAIIKGTKRIEAARKLIDFLVSAETELALARSKSRQVPLGPVDETQLSDEVRRLKEWADEGVDLRPLLPARRECLEWLKSEYLR